MGLLTGKYALFFLIVFLLYFIVPLKHRWYVLLCASYYFFIVNSAQMTFFLLFTSVSTFYIGKKLGAMNEETAAYLAANKSSMDREEKKAYKALRTQKKRRILTVGIVMNMGILCILKYTAFLFRSINGAFAALGLSLALPGVHFLLPLGISFYSFSAVSYIVDVYRGKYKPDEHLLRYMLFVSYFPQMVQGPIGRHDHLADQLYEGHRFDYRRATKGLQLVLWGLLKKFILAERLCKVSNEIFYNYTSYAGLTMFLCAVAYGVYMYADFSGGIDVVTGLSQMLGIDLAPNFQRPYFAKSLSEFWNRWHMSLGEWMKDYVFYSLSLSKKFTHLGRKAKQRFGVQIGKVVPAFLASFITFVLVGVWQGAGWHYITYGIWNATIISMSVMLKPVFVDMNSRFHVKTTALPWMIFCMVRTFLITSFGRFFSGSPDLHTSLVMIKSFLTVWNPQVLFNGTFLQMGLGRKDWVIILCMVLVMLIVGIYQERGVHLRDTIASLALPVRWGIYIGAILFLIIFGMYGPGYVAADFIYQQY